MPMANYLEEQVLNAIFRTAAFTKPSQIVIELLKTLPSDDAGTGLAAADFTGYAHNNQDAPINGDWSDPSLGTQGETDNSNELTFGTNTGTLQRVIGVAIYNETAKTNLLFVQALANNWRMFSANEANEQLCAFGHGLSVDDRVFVRNISGMAGGPSEATEYFVGTVPDADHFTLAGAASNGSPVTFTTDGYGEVGDSQAKDIATNDEAKIAVGALNISLD